MSNSKKPVIHQASLTAEIAEQNKREALFDSVVSDLGGASFEAELNGPNSDAAITKLMDAIAGGSL
jgi:hypothetical protein